MHNINDQIGKVEDIIHHLFLGEKDCVIETHSQKTEEMFNFSQKPTPYNHEKRLLLIVGPDPDGLWI
ncbi:MAG: hypothetical protein Tsb0034_16700 [Ekhidna sp.]